MCGLKSAPEAWGAAFLRVLRKWGFVPHQLDDTAWLGAILIHVEDLLVLGEPDEVTRIMKVIGKKFKSGVPVLLWSTTASRSFVFLGHGM